MSGFRNGLIRRCWLHPSMRSDWLGAVEIGLVACVYAYENMDWPIFVSHFSQTTPYIEVLGAAVQGASII